MAKTGHYNTFEITKDQIKSASVSSLLEWANEDRFQDADKIRMLTEVITRQIERINNMSQDLINAETRILNIIETTSEHFA